MTKDELILLSIWYIIGIDKDGPEYEEIDSLIKSLFGSNHSGELLADFLIQKLKENEANPA